jgi:iron complex outermembrane receptor protein
MTRRTIRKQKFRASACAVLALALSPVPAVAQTQTYQLDIPAMDLGEALRTFARQTGQQVVFSGSAVRGRRSNAIRGSYTARAALDQIIARSGVAVSVGSGGIFMVTPAQGETEAGSAAAENGSADREAIAEILVTGQRTLNVDVRRSEDDVQPYVVFQADDVTRSGATSLEEFFRSRLPMNGQQGLANQGNGSFSGQINLRGLGTNQTLILVDGRRIPSVADGRELLQGSINGIPISQIERIEVLPTTASGIYGGGATGGAINIVLKRDYSGLDLSLSYGNTFRGDADTSQLTLSGGFALEEGRTRVRFGLSRVTQGGLTADERDALAVRSRSLLLANNPSAATTPIVGLTPNICATATTSSTTCSATNLVLDPEYGGASLGSSRTFVPVGYTGIASDNAAALLANAGQFNLSAAENSASLLQSMRSESVSFDIRREFGPRVEAFIDFYGDRTRTQRLVGSELTLNLPAASPFNPFQQNIAVSLPGPSYSLPATRTIETLRVRGGVIVRLPHNWSATLEYGWSEARSRFRQPTFQGGTTDGLAYLRSIALRDPNAVPIEAPASRYNVSLNEIGSPDPFTNELTDAALRFGGPLARLPAGPLTLTGLVEHREENRRTAFQRVTVTPAGTVTFNWSPPQSQDVTSGYLEARLPIFGSANAQPLLRELELTASIRHDRYSIRSGSGGVTVPSEFGPFPDIDFVNSEPSSTDYTVGLTYAPIEDIRFRASFGTGFLPPALFQLSPFTDSIQASVPAMASLRDPLRGNTALVGDASGNVTRISGGNPDLQPERSESLSFGVILTPRFLSGFRLSVDYVRIKKNDEITAPDRQFVIDSETEFPGRIVRGPNLPGDPAGWAGPIILIDSSPLNLATSDIRAVDVQADYALETRSLGTWRFYAVATHQARRRSQALPTTPSVDTIGFSGGILEWRGNAGIDWRMGPWSAGWNAQYYDGYSVCTATQAANACASAALGQGSERIPSQTYHDFYLTYRVGERGAFGSRSLAGTEISVGVQNAFDNMPPILAGTAPSYSTYGDPRLRRFTLTLRKQFGR